jgi:hypothetical protein
MEEFTDENTGDGSIKSSQSLPNYPSRGKFNAAFRDAYHNGAGERGHAAHSSQDFAHAIHAS